MSPSRRTAPAIRLHPATCRQCGEHGVHATADACIAALTKAIKIVKERSA